MQEHRKLARWQINRQARFNINQTPPDALICHVKDINYKGISVVCESKLPQDTAFRLYFKFSDDCAFDAEAWVVWNKVSGGINHYGLFFTRLKDVDKEKIYKFINSYCPQEVVQKWWPGKAEIKEPEVKEAKTNEGGAEMTDKRIFERFGKRLSARFIDLNSGEEGGAQTVDVSAKGLGFSTEQELKLHANLEIWLDLPEMRGPLYTRGQVVWSKEQGEHEYRAGIELEKADLMGLSQVMRV